MARKDRLNPAYTDDNVILVCRMCFYTEGYSRRRPFKRGTKAEMSAARDQAVSTLERAFEGIQE